MRRILEIKFLQTILGYCYLTPAWDISIFHPCCACVNVIPHCYFLMTTTTTKQQQHLVNYVSIVAASNETLTFYFRFQMTNIICV